MFLKVKIILNMKLIIYKSIALEEKIKLKLVVRENELKEDMRETTSTKTL